MGDGPEPNDRPRSLDDLDWQPVVHDTPMNLPAGVQVLLRHVEGSCSVWSTDSIRSQGWAACAGDGPWPEAWVVVSVYSADELFGSEEPVFGGDEDHADEGDDGKVH